MAESFVQVTEGVGKKLHTFDRVVGTNTVHDEVTLNGEQILPSYVVNMANAGVLLTTANSHLLQIMAGASLKVRIRRIEIYQVTLATTAQLAPIIIYRLTTAGTGGGVLTPAPLDTTDAASGATAMTLPSAKGTEAASILSMQGYWIQTAGASTQNTQPLLVADFDRPRSKPLVIPAGTGNGIAIKNPAAVAGAGVFINVWFDESSF